MKSTEYAVLANGKKVPYIYRPDPPCGGMKHTYFTPDGSYVVQFYNHKEVAEDPLVHQRLEAIIGKYNPTLSEEEGGAKGNTKRLAAYFSNYFCWPVAIVKEPEFGIVCPAYPPKFFFDKTSSDVLNLTGKDKKSTWFTYKNRRYLNKSETGDLKSLLKMSMCLARAVRRMHQAGLAHSDLSCNNVLIDPKSGSCIIIDIDSLVVPGVFPPEVSGTRGYMAPEILKSWSLPFGHPQRRQPGVYTDLHALAVLIYEYLFCRHPLIGNKIHSYESQGKNEFLTFGPQALFIENPEDTSNARSDLKMTIRDMGPVLEKLFFRAFVEGLHEPEKRPTAMEWERGIAVTLDMMHRCSNPMCEKQWFVLYQTKNVICPYCKGKFKEDSVVTLRLKKRLQGFEGHWVDLRGVDVTENIPLYPWHLYDNVYPDEKTESQEMALLIKRNGQWFLLNKEIKGLISSAGTIVPKGELLPLATNPFFHIEDGVHGLLFEVQVTQV